MQLVHVTVTPQRFLAMSHYHLKLFIVIGPSDSCAIVKPRPTSTYGQPQRGCSLRDDNAPCTVQAR